MLAFVHRSHLPSSALGTTRRLVMLGFLVLCTSLALLAGVPDVNNDARFKGNFGAQFQAGDGADGFVEDARPEAEKSYGARFYLRLIDLQLGNGNSLVVFRGLNSSAVTQFELQVQASGTQHLMKLRVRLDNGTFSESTDIQVPFGWQGIEVMLTAADGDGQATLALNGAQVANLAGLSNSNLQIDAVRLGKMSESGSGNSGTLEVDDFRSRQITTIGTLCLSNDEFLGFNAEWPARNIREQASLANRRCMPAPAM